MQCICVKCSAVDLTGFVCSYVLEPLRPVLARCGRRHDVPDEEKAVQVRGAVLPRGADGGAVRVGGTLR